MNPSTEFFLRAIYPGINFDNMDDLGLFLYAHSQREPGVEYRALRQIVLNLIAAGLRGNQLRSVFVAVCHEIDENGAITSLTPHEATLLLNMCPPEEEN